MILDIDDFDTPASRAWLRRLLHGAARTRRVRPATTLGVDTVRGRPVDLRQAKSWPDLTNFRTLWTVLMEHSTFAAMALLSKSAWTRVAMAMRLASIPVKKIGLF